MSRRTLVQRFETKQALRDVLTAIWLEEALYKLVEILREIEAGNT